MNKRIKAKIEEMVENDPLTIQEVIGEIRHLPNVDMSSDELFDVIKDLNMEEEEELISYYDRRSI
jgi:hypothetical protein